MLYLEFGVFRSIILTVLKVSGLCYTGQEWLIQTRLIRSSAQFEVTVNNFPNISSLKCTINSNFYLIRSKTLPTNDFELAVPDL